MKIEASVRRRHDGLTNAAVPLMKAVEELLRVSAADRGWHFDHRIKALESFALKQALGRPIDDFYACSLIVPTLAEVPAATQLVEGCFDVLDRRPKPTIRARPTQFDFDSLRLYCRLKASVRPSSHHQLRFEVQIKTLLGEAWSKATHDFSYKSGEISWARERLASQLKAMLDHVELAIEQADTLSTAPSISRVNQEYVDKAELLAWLRDDLGASGGMSMPIDLRRLTDAVWRLLRLLGAKLVDLQGWISAETAVGRGTSTLDLSIYSMILQSALNQHSSAFAKIRHNNDVIFLPSEVENAVGGSLSAGHPFRRMAEDDGSGLPLTG